MTNADKNIVDALKKIDQDANYDDTRESGLRDMLVSSFQGQMKKATLITWACMAVFGAVAVVAAVELTLVHAVADMVMCGMVFTAAFMTILVVKLWYWMLANRNALSREIKMLQLQLAELKGQREAK